MARRSNGEGSIYLRRDGLWCGSIMLGSKRRVVYGKTRKEAAQKLAALQQQTARVGSLIHPSRLTVEIYLKQWVETKAPNVRPKTLRSYLESIKPVLPFLGSLRLSNLRPTHVLALYAERGGQAPRRTQLIHRTLFSAMQNAVRWEMLPANPLANVQEPKAERKERVLWSQEETRKFLAYTQ